MRPHISIDEDDGSILLEFVDGQRRFGIAIESKLEDSSWYFVDKVGVLDGGLFPLEVLETLIGSLCGGSE